MKYSIRLHGDLLEKEAASFIDQHLCNYEEVWKIYIGNTGNASKAKLPNYPDEKRRTHFAENSYTVLESAFIIHETIESGILEQPINGFTDYLKYNSAFISFFANLGRMHDTIIKASYCFHSDKSLKKSIQHFYEARNIIIHGKRIPLILDELNLPKMPLLKTSIVKGDAWDDILYTWPENVTMQSTYVEDDARTYFDDLLKLINRQYATLKDDILKELKSIPTELIFEYNPTQFLNAKDNVIMPSGSRVDNSFDIEAAKRYLDLPPDSPQIQ